LSDAAKSRRKYKKQALQGRRGTVIFRRKREKLGTKVQTPADGTKKLLAIATATEKKGGATAKKPQRKDEIKGIYPREINRSAT